MLVQGKLMQIIPRATKKSKPPAVGIERWILKRFRRQATEIRCR